MEATLNKICLFYPEDAKTWVPPKRRYIYTTLHYVTSHETVLPDNVLFKNNPSHRTVRHYLAHLEPQSATFMSCNL